MTKLMHARLFMYHNIDNNGKFNFNVDRMPSKLSLKAAAGYENQCTMLFIFQAAISFNDDIVS